MKLNINKRFQEFRESIISDVYDALMEIGGTLDMQNCNVLLKFQNYDTSSDVDEEFRCVQALNLHADKEQKGMVILSTVDCSGLVVETDISDLSADEIYNVLCKAAL